MNIRTANATDAPQIAEIYNYYIASSHATFELDPITGNQMLERMQAGWLAGHPFFVAESDGQLAGYAHGRQFRPRKAYLHSIEVSVYLKQEITGQGVATLLYGQLFDEIRKGDFHAIIAGISLPNDASVRLHEKFGFEKVAHFREVGFKFDRWIDVGYWEMMIR